MRKSLEKQINNHTVATHAIPSTQDKENNRPQSPATSTTTAIKNLPSGQVVASFAEAYASGEMTCVCALDKNSVWTAGSAGQLAIYDSQRLALVDKKQTSSKTSITCLASVCYNSHMHLWCGNAEGIQIIIVVSQLQ